MMPTIYQQEFQKSLKHIYDDLLEAGKNQEKDPSGFRNRLQEIHETLQNQEMRICACFGLVKLHLILK